jgi:AraC family transcriptional regulator
MSRPMSEGSGLFGRVSLMEIDRPVGAHAHPQCHALFKIDGDDSVFEVDGRHYPMSTDTAVLVNAWQPHSYPFMPAAQNRARVLALYVEPDWMARVDALLESSARRDFFREPCVRLPVSIRRHVRELAHELQGRRADAARACALLQRIMVELTLRYSRYREIPAWARSAPSTVSDYRIRRALGLIAERAATRLDMGAVAREVALSRSHFFEAFRRSLGMTPNAYRNVLRMERAYRSLLETSIPVNRIAAELGFSVHADFTRFFRTNHGVSPEAYRGAAWRIP